MNISLICFSSHILKKQEYEARMLCIKIYYKYCAIVNINEKTNNDLALGFIKCMNDMGGPPKVIVTDGEGAINNGGLVQK